MNLRGSPVIIDTDIAIPKWSARPHTCRMAVYA